MRATNSNFQLPNSYCRVRSKIRRARIILHVGELLLDPPADDVEHLPPVVLHHHEMTVAEHAAIFELQILGVAAAFLEPGHERRPLRETRLRRRDVYDRNAAEF